jgi:hypothetical protein
VRAETYVYWLSPAQAIHIQYADLCFGRGLERRVDRTLLTTAVCTLDSGHAAWARAVVYVFLNASLYRTLRFRSSSRILRGSGLWLRRSPFQRSHPTFSPFEVPHQVFIIINLYNYSLLQAYSYTVDLYIGILVFATGSTAHTLSRLSVLTSVPYCVRRVAPIHRR